MLAAKISSRLLLDATIAASITIALVMGVPAYAAEAGKPVAGIPCEREEHFDLHIHAHVDVFVDGKPLPIPEGVGIVGRSCLYWMHTHDRSGIVHIESPEVRSFTVGQFIELWRATAPGAPPAKQNPKVLIDGKRAKAEWNRVEFVDLVEIAIVYGADPTEIPSYYVFPLEYRKGPFRKPS
jgi:hypothetical protein